MTCFWDSLIQALPIKEYQQILGISGKKIKPHDLVVALKRYAVPTRHVVWNSVPLSEQEIRENLEMIRNFDAATISRGYDCSICDPFLLLVCELFKVNIEHQYMRSTISYKYENPADQYEPRTWRFKSSKSHMCFIRS